MAEKRPSSRVSTAEDRAALFDYIYNKTMQREAFSSIKNEKLRLDIGTQMMRLRDEIVAADTDQALFYALIKLSNTRKDRHLKVLAIHGGLDVKSKSPNHEAPIRFAVDFGELGSYFFFVADLAQSAMAKNDSAAKAAIGDKLIRVNGRSVEDHVAAVEPYYRYSTINNLWSRLAAGLSRREVTMPPDLYRDLVTFQLENSEGKRYTLTLPYLPPDTINWQKFLKRHGDHRYPNFKLVFSTQTYDLYRYQGKRRILLLDWYGFRGDLVIDVDRLATYAAKNDLLGYALIWDGTRSRGGSKGAYAIQRLTSKPFKTTFGNLRISDITTAFIDLKRAERQRQRVDDHGVAETMDRGRWLMDWLNTDVRRAITRGEAYSNNVPFKSAHLPKDSDGVLQPTKVHFSGPLICWLSPYGGSHLDQFAAMIVDNKLGHTMGMSTGGYSNTWEWVEDLVFPISKKPVVKYMWSIGHTIRPNGEILEGNPAQVAESIPMTRENYLDYYNILIKRSLVYLDSIKK